MSHTVQFVRHERTVRVITSLPATWASSSHALVALAAGYGALVLTILLNSSEIEVTFGRLRLVFRLRR